MKTLKEMTKKELFRLQKKEPTGLAGGEIWERFQTELTQKEKVMLFILTPQLRDQIWDLNFVQRLTSSQLIKIIRKIPEFKDRAVHIFQQKSLTYWDWMIFLLKIREKEYRKTAWRGLWYCFLTT